MKKIFVFIFVLIFSDFTFSQNKESVDLKYLFGDMRARHIGPALMSGRINDLEKHPTNSRIIYAGTAGGGVWKSNDAGTTFNPIFDQYCQSIGAVTLDPNKPDKIIYVGTGETWTRNSVSIGDGLYKSIDGGNNWEKIGFEKSERISNIIVNPNNSAAANFFESSITTRIFDACESCIVTVKISPSMGCPEIETLTPLMEKALTEFVTKVCLVPRSVTSHL